MAPPKYNAKSPAVKRLLREAAELHEPTYNYYAQPLEENLFEWHFTIRGPEDTPFENGIYHGRIVLPPEYPMKPPNVIFMTPNGRFELHKKICLSISGYHPETWRPSWSIRTALLAMIGFMPTHGNGAIGSLDYPDSERKALSNRSAEFKCSLCGKTADLLESKPAEENDEADEIKKYSAQLKVTKPAGEKSIDDNENDTSEPKIGLSEVEHIEELPLREEGENQSDHIPEIPSEIEADDEAELVEEEVPTSTPTRPNDIASFALMWFLILVIAFLVYRRLNKTYGIDLVEVLDQYLTSLFP